MSPRIIAAGSEPQRILVINTARIGDVLFSTPAIRGLRAAFPNACINALCHPKRMDVLRHNPDISKLGAYGVWQHVRGLCLGRKEYDLVVIFAANRKVMAYARAVGKRTVGFAEADGSANPRLDGAVPRPTTPLHAVDERMLLLQAIGIPAAGRGLVYCLGEEDRAFASSFMEHAGLQPGILAIGFQVAGFPSRAFRDWPEERFVELGRLIRQRVKAKILLFGDTHGAAKAKRIAADLGPDVLMLAGKTSLRQFAALMEACNAFVTTETGPMHLAFAVGVPTVALLHCITPATLLGPTAHAERHRLIQMEPPAGAACSKQLSLGEIRSDRAWKALVDILGGPKDREGVEPQVTARTESGARGYRLVRHIREGGLGEGQK